MVINRRVNYIIIQRANGNNEIMLVTRQPRVFARHNIILEQRRRHIVVSDNIQEESDTNYDSEDYDFDTEPYSDSDEDNIISDQE